MKKIKKFLIFTLTLVLTAASAGAVFADDIDYSQWNSTTAYPSDVSTSSTLFQSVKYLIDNDIITGYEDGTFRPNDLMTRAEIAVAVTKMMNLTNLASANESKNYFSDLGGYGWAKGSINTLVDQNVMKGVSASAFNPSANITYAQLITTLIRTRSSAASELEAYGTWPDNYINYAIMYNLIGTEVTITDWNAYATRADVARLMYRIGPK